MIMAVYAVVDDAQEMVTVPAELFSAIVIFDAAIMALPDAEVLDMASATMPQFETLLLVRITKPRTVPTVRVIVILPPPDFEPV